MTDQSPAQKELAAYIAFKKACSKGGKKRWKGKTKAQRSAIMSKVAMSKVAMAKGDNAKISESGPVLSPSKDRSANGDAHTDSL